MPNYVIQRTRSRTPLMPGVRSHMESQVIFRGSLKKALMLLLISIGFVVLGAWAITEEPIIG